MTSQIIKVKIINLSLHSKLNGDVRCLLPVLLIGLCAVDWFPVRLSVYC